VLATYSVMIVATAEERESHLDEARAMLAERFPGASEVEVPIGTWAWRCTRVS
jgi:hypothetical protein